MGKLSKKINKNKKVPMNQAEAYLRGFREGQEKERRRCLEYFADKLLGLKEVEGIGDKTFEKIYKFIDEGMK